MLYRYNAERRAADLRAAKEAWEARAYDADGHLQGTVPEDVLLSETNVTSPSAPPTDYEWGVSKVELAKAQKDQREEMRLINEQEAARFHLRMAAKARKEGRSVPVRRPSYSGGHGVSKTAFGVSSPYLRSVSTDSRRLSASGRQHSFKADAFSRVSIPEKPQRQASIEDEDEDGYETEESGEEGEEEEEEEENA